MVTAAVTTEASEVPANLPTGTAPIFVTTDIDEGPQEEEVDMKELEDYAHAHNVLLSSDAMRHFIVSSRDAADTLGFLDQVISEAKHTYPSEDGWEVLNLARMQEICAKIVDAPETPSTFTPVNVVLNEAIADDTIGIGSLAEAIVTGNVKAAYQMTQSRPMVALADAAADLDAIYRMRKGTYVADAHASEMLKEQVKELSDKTLEDTILALTGSIDGTYTDEAAAVKIAVMKAINVITE